MLVNVCHQFGNPVWPSRARRTPPPCAWPLERLRGRRLHQSRERLRQCNLVKLQARNCKRYVRKIALNRQLEIASLPVCIFYVRKYIFPAGSLQYLKKATNFAESRAVYGAIKMTEIRFSITKILEPIDIVVRIFGPTPSRCSNRNNDNSPTANCLYCVVTIDRADAFDHCLSFAGRNPLPRCVFQHNRTLKFCDKTVDFGR